MNVVCKKRSKVSVTTTRTMIEGGGEKQWKEKKKKNDRYAGFQAPVYFK